MGERCTYCHRIIPADAEVRYHVRVRGRLLLCCSCECAERVVEVNRTLRKIEDAVRRTYELYHAGVLP